MLVRTAFPNCCAIEVIHSFIDNNAENHKIIEQEIMAFNSWPQKPGLSLVAITDSQAAYSEEILERNSYIPLVQGFINPIHNSSVNLYGRIGINSDYIIGGPYGRIKRLNHPPRREAEVKQASQGTETALRYFTISEPTYTSTTCRVSSGRFGW